MLRNLFTKSLRDERRATLWWAGGLIALTAYLVLFYPSVRDNPSYGELLKAMPDSLKAAIGLNGDPTSPAGYLQAEFFGLMIPLLFLINAIAQGARAIATEEESGTLDLLLANPISRSRVVLEKFLSLAAGLCALGIALWLGLWIGGNATGLTVGAGHLLAATARAVALGLAFGALALLVGCATGRHGPSVGIPAAVGAAGYVWQSVSSIVTGLAPYRKLSPFYYYSAGDPLRHGAGVGYVAVLLVSAAVLIAAALVLFDRRDLAV